MRMALGRRRRSLTADALLGAASGLIASWVMEQVQRPLMKAGGPAVKERERAARGGFEPSTIRAARRAAELAGTSVPEERTRGAGAAVHYVTGAVAGALFGFLARRFGGSVVAGTLFGVAVWLVLDEGLVPALKLSREPWKYPPSTHAKAFASHLVYGAATGAGYRLLARAVSRTHLSASSPRRRWGAAHPLAPR